VYALVHRRRRTGRQKYMSEQAEFSVIVQTDFRRIKPCCCLLIRLRSSRYRSNVLLIIRSITLQHVAVKDIGRKLFGSEVGPFLTIIVTDNIQYPSLCIFNSTEYNLQP